MTLLTPLAARTFDEVIDYNRQFVRSDCYDIEFLSIPTVYYVPDEIIFRSRITGIDGLSEYAANYATIQTIDIGPYAAVQATRSKIKPTTLTIKVVDYDDCVIGKMLTDCARKTSDPNSGLGCENGELSWNFNIYVLNVKHERIRRYKCRGMLLKPKASYNEVMDGVGETFIGQDQTLEYTGFVYPVEELV